MHLLLSLFYLILVVLLVGGYSYLTIITFRYLKQIWRGIRKRKWTLKTITPGKDCWSVSSSRLCVIGCVCLLLATGLYLFERSRWINEDSAHLEAKKYFVVGIVLMDFRAVGHRIFYPERMIWKPAVWLQKLITFTGLRYIPEDDGERAVWAYHFVLAPYINRVHAPHNRAVYPLIDTSKYVLETLVTYPCADKNFNHKNKYIIYPLVSLYYQFSYKRRYFVKPSPKVYYEGLYKDPEQYNMLKQVVEWALTMESEWADHPKVVDHMKNKPMIELTHLVSVSLLLHDIILYQIHNLIFTCDDRHLDLYYEYVTRYRAEGSPYYRVDDQTQSRFDNPVIYHGAPINFFGHSLCGRPKLPAFNVRTTWGLKGEGPGWYESFIELNRKLHTKEEQQKILERFKAKGRTY